VRLASYRINTHQHHASIYACSCARNLVLSAALASVVVVESVAVVAGVALSVAVRRVCSWHALGARPRAIGGVGVTVGLVHAHDHMLCAYEFPREQQRIGVLCLRAGLHWDTRDTLCSMCGRHVQRLDRRPCLHLVWSVVH